MNRVAASQTVRVILADDHDLVRSGIKVLLTMIRGVEVVAEASNGQRLIDLAESLNPDVVMTDISMPMVAGITAMAHLHRTRPGVRLLALSMHDSADFVQRAVASGACGYLLKDAPPAELEQALRQVMTSGHYFSPAVTQRMLQPAEPTADDELTPRQVEILKLIAQGRASKEIAFDLGLSPKTVDVHRSRIMERLQLGDIANLTLYAVRKGLIKP